MLDLLQALDRHLPRQLEVRAGRRPEPQDEFAPNRSAGTARCRPATPASQRTRPHAAEISRHHEPAQANEPVPPPCHKPRETGRTARASLAMPPLCLTMCTHRIGTNMIESRYAEIMANPTARVSGMNSDRSGSFMINAGMNTDRMQSSASRIGTAVALARAQHRRGDVWRLPHLHVHVLDGHRRHIDEDADRQRHAAQRHDVDRVARQPEPDQRPQQGQRDVGHDDEHAPQVAEEQQDHQPGQARADQALGSHALDGRHHGRRLVELEVDRDVLGDGVAEHLHRLVDVRHDGQASIPCPS